MESLQALKRRLTEIDDLRRATAVLSWDQTTYMPPAGGTARRSSDETLSGATAMCAQRAFSFTE